MFVTIIILIITSAIISMSLKFFLYDILCLPVNFVYYKKRKSDFYNQNDGSQIISFLGGVLLIILFTYLFTGISASFLSYATIRSGNSTFLKCASIAIALGSPFALKDRTRSLLRLNAESINIPSVFASIWFSYTALITSFLILFFPELMRFWNWMPFVS